MHTEMDVVFGMQREMQHSSSTICFTPESRVPATHPACPGEADPGLRAAGSSAWLH